MAGPDQHLLVEDLLGKPGQIIKWLEEQPPASQNDIAAAIFNRIYSEAAQPKSVSGNACVRLCGFVEQSSKSQAENARSWAFSYDVTLRLFNFYIDWNEYDHHRSMRLVLDLIALLLQKNPDQQAASATRKALLDNLIAIITGKSTKPVAKSAIRTLDHFLVKDAFSLEGMKASYAAYRDDVTFADAVELWGVFIGDLLDWMRLHFVCPAAGKFIVSLYRRLRQQQDASHIPSVDTWHSWLLKFLTKEPLLVERIKNYVFLPLFKIDRKEALLFLQRMNEGRPVSTAEKVDVDIPALLQLAALETGKKVGLVEEPDLGDGDQDLDRDDSSIILHEKVLESVLAHPSHEVRSLAFSILITSPSTTKPYSSTALSLLRKHLGAFFADPDAKFRVDVSARARDMFKRVRGAIFVLKRSIPRARAKAAKLHQPASEANANAAVLYRANLISLPENQLTYCLNYHEEFFRWYLQFLCDELVPTASYQRHIASLKALGYILRMEGEKSKTWETSDDQQLYFDVFDDKWARALFDLLMDAFEDVRSTTSTVLTSIFNDTRYRKFCLQRDATSQRPSEELLELSKKANELARRTARADHADGVARINQLLYRFLGSAEQRLSLLALLISDLETKIAMAETDLGRAVLEAPVHGDFASLSSTWKVVSELTLSEEDLEAVRKLQEKLFECCTRSWISVKDILCDDSPEGHLPQDLEEFDGLDTKGLLSYSFRAAHESSNLMKTMILAIRNRSRKGLITPTKEVFMAIGNLTFDQLCNLRHRGAFSTVSSTFTTCCQQSKHLDLSADDQSVLTTWYNGTMDAINSQVSTTRRSAGIPSLMTGVLSANAAQPSFEEVMEKLMEIASIEAYVSETDGSKLPQVHAYNCLKDIFKNSLLTSMGNKSEKYLPQCLELAASGLRSEVWAIRNCGLIFLRSLIDCLFGSHESKSMIEAGWDGKANRIPYHRYPNLPEVLRSLLKSGHQMMTVTPDATSAAESVFPALDIIRRAGPPELLRAEIQGHIINYLSSPVWHVREMAARTLCSCLLHDQWLVTLKGVFEAALSADSSRHNYIHGALLTVKFVFERLSEVSLDLLTGDLPELTLFLSETQVDVIYAYCPDIIAAYLEVVNTIWYFQLQNALPMQPAAVTTSSAPSLALYKTQKAVNDILIASQAGDPMASLREVLLGAQLGLNTLVMALETIPKIWSTAASHESKLLSLLTLYIDIVLGTTFVDAQTVAVENLAEVLDALLKGRHANKLPTSKLIDLWTCLPLQPMSPALSNAVIRASGGIVAALFVTGNVQSSGLLNWGNMISEAGLEDKGFDTRFAAAESLCSFFTVVQSQCKSADFLTVILALYDTLNDDDEEVRDLGSDAFKNIIGVSLVPIEAATCLLQWLSTTFGALPEFRAVVASRIVGDGAITSSSLGCWKSADQQLTTAMQFDDSLFVVEEQNLFIDEVRETTRWIEVFQSLAWESEDAALVALHRWLHSGVNKMRELASTEDVPLGWASNPDVFAICTRIIQGVVAMNSKGYASVELSEEALKLGNQAASQKHVISRLLMDALNKD